MSLTQIKSIFGAGGACILGGLTTLLGGWDMWLQVLIIFMAIDIFTGVLAGFYNKEINSSVGFKGGIKKIIILCIVVVAFQLDMLIGTEIIRVVVIGFYIGLEGLSILENATKAGLEIHPKLTEALEQVKGDEKGDEIDENNRN